MKELVLDTFLSLIAIQVQHFIDFYISRYLKLIVVLSKLEL